MSVPIDAVEVADGAVAELVEAGPPSEVFAALLRGATAAAPRVGILLARHGVFRGWATHGLSTADDARFRGSQRAADAGWPDRIASPSGLGIERRRPEEAPALAEPSAEEVAVAIRVGDRTAAIVVAGREPGAEPWLPALLALLARVAALRLELDLERRRGTRSAETAAPSPTPPSPDGALAAVEPGRQDDSAQPDLATARRFARLVATDIRLYNEEAVVLGRRHGDLAERLRESLDRGQDTFDRKFPALGPEGRRVLREALVQVLAGGDETLLPG